MAGTIVGIYVAETEGADLKSLDRATAVAGKGLEGDRYAAGIGFYSPHPTTPGARELTLIDADAVAVISDAIGEEFGFARTRRNLITQGADLDKLLGKRFAIGGIVCEGVRDCPPCIHLEELTGLKIMKPMLRLGGLRARIVDGGTITVGDGITVIGEAQGEVARGA